MSLASELLRHYVDYLSAPAVLLTFCLLVGPLCYNLYGDASPTRPQKPRSLVPGCRRLGTSAGRDDAPTLKVAKTRDRGAEPQVKAIFAYPIGTFKAIEVCASEVDETGLRHDNLFTFAQLHSEQATAEGTSEPSTQWQHTWRTISARDHTRLGLLDMELWVPDPRQKVASSHTKTGSGDSVFGINKSRSRSRQGTLVMESAGQEAEKRRKFSVPVAISDNAVNGGCLVIRFPFEPDFNLFGLFTEIVTIKLPLQPTTERAEAKGHRTEEVHSQHGTVNATNLAGEVDPSALEKLRYFLGISKPLAIFQKDPFDPEPEAWGSRDLAPNEDLTAHSSGSGPLRMVNLGSVRANVSNNTEPVELLQRLRPNVVLEGAPASAETRWRRIAFGRCVPPRGGLPERGRNAVSGFSSRGKFLVDHRPARSGTNEADASLVHLSPSFDYGIIRVGDRVEVLESAEK